MGSAFVEPSEQRLQFRILNDSLIRDNNASLITGDPACVLRRFDIHRMSLAE
jgi:hypothetical protein